MANKFKNNNKWFWAALAVLLAVTIAWWLTRPAQKMPQVSNGKLECHERFVSRYVPPRTVWVWLPAGYSKGDACDVLYMHDGQMLFDAGITWNGQEWQVDEIAGQLMADSAIRRCIVVGIDNTSDRLKEYFPTKASQYLPDSIQANVHAANLLGDNYLRFVVEELKPFIDRQYKPLTTREHTFLMGSSMGGLISLYAVCEYPEVFGGAGCLSTHLSFEHLDYGPSGQEWAAAFCDYVGAHMPAQNSTLIYMDHGTEDIDADYAPFQQQIDSLFADRQWDAQHYVSRVYQGHEHKEIFWAKRLEQPLLLLLGQ